MVFLYIHRYFIYGLQDAQHLERVRLEFQMFEIQKGEHKDKDKELVESIMQLFCINNFEAKHFIIIMIKIVVVFNFKFPEQIVQTAI